MAQWPFSELINGTKRLFVALQGHKSNGTPENIKTNDNGALKIDGTVTGIIKVSGDTVQIGETTYQVSNGNILRGKAADKPSASDAHAAIPYCFYYSIDNGKIEVTDSTNWVEL